MNKLPRSIRIAMMGIALESYNVVLYGYFAALISPLYFPAENPTASALLAMGAFALSFVMRPLGGLIFGYFGDRVSRKNAMLSSVVLMSLSTFFIGVLPTYSAIGIWAPVFLSLALFLQGMCAGGAYSGAAIFVNEHAKRGREGLAGSLINTSGIFGAVLVTCLGALFTLPGMPAWAWRLPFLLGGVLGFAIYMIRQAVHESPSFQPQRQHNPLLSMLRYRKSTMICTMGIGACAFIPYHTVSVFMNMFLNTKTQVAPSQVFLLNLFTMVLWIFFLPLMGHLSDRIGRRRLMSLSAYATVAVGVLGIWGMLTFPTQLELSLLHLGTLQVSLSFIGAAFSAPASAFVSRLFPAEERCTGMGFCYFLGVALFGGTTPLIHGLLIKWTGSILAPGIYLAFAGLMGLIAVALADPKLADSKVPSRA